MIRGIAYDRKGEHDRAIADYAEAIRLDPKSAKAYYNRGIAYDHKASMTAPSPISMRPSASTRKTRTPIISRGVAYNRKGDYDRAIADYGEAIRLDPQNAHAYTRRATSIPAKAIITAPSLILDRPSASTRNTR